MNLEDLRHHMDMINLLWWLRYGDTTKGGDNVAKACKFCHFLNSYVCDNQDCIECGKCLKSNQH